MTSWDGSTSTTTEHGSNRSEVNIGYNVFSAFRGRGYATRAVLLLLHHLAVDTDWSVATLLIHPENTRSLALARRAGFDHVDDLDGNPYWKRAVAPLHNPGGARLDLDGEDERRSGTGR